MSIEDELLKRVKATDEEMKLFKEMGKMTPRVRSMVKTIEKIGSLAGEIDKVKNNLNKEIQGINKKYIQNIKQIEKQMSRQMSQAPFGRNGRGASSFDTVKLKNLQQKLIREEEAKRHSLIEKAYKKEEHWENKLNKMRSDGLQKMADIWKKMSKKEKATMSSTDGEIPQEDTPSRTTPTKKKSKGTIEGFTSKFGGLASFLTKNPIGAIASAAIAAGAYSVNQASKTADQRYEYETLTGKYNQNKLLDEIELSGVNAGADRYQQIESAVQLAREVGTADTQSISKIMSDIAAAGKITGQGNEALINLASSFRKVAGSEKETNVESNIKRMLDVAQRSRSSYYKDEPSRARYLETISNTLEEIAEGGSANADLIVKTIDDLSSRSEYFRVNAQAAGAVTKGLSNVAENNQLISMRAAGLAASEAGRGDISPFKAELMGGLAFKDKGTWNRIVNEGLKEGDKGYISQESYRDQLLGVIKSQSGGNKDIFAMLLKQLGVADTVAAVNLAFAEGKAKPLTQGESILDTTNINKSASGALRTTGVKAMSTVENVAARGAFKVSDVALRDDETVASPAKNITRSFGRRSHRGWSDMEALLGKKKEEESAKEEKKDQSNKEQISLQQQANESLKIIADALTRKEKEEDAKILIPKDDQQFLA